MTLFHVASVVCALVGAFILGAFFADHGAGITLLGAVAGLVAGWFIGPLLVFAVFFMVVLIKEGPRSAYELLRRRRKA